MAKKRKPPEAVGGLDDMQKRLEKSPPAAPAGEGAEDPPPSAREDLGYGGRDGKRKGGRRRLSPAEREQSELLAELISDDTRDIARAEEARKKASEPLKEARARLKKHLAQNEVVQSGNWQPGLFEKQEQEEAAAADGDGAEDE